MPTPGRVEAGDIAKVFSEQLSAEVAQVVAQTGSPPRLVGFLANDDAGAAMYAKWTERSCTRDGIAYELRRVERVDLEAAVMAANADPAVHGIMIYYPVFGGPIDDYLRDVVALEKDVEGLNHRYRYSMYHNIRHLDAAGRKKCVLPCTPLAVVKILEHLGAYDRALPVGRQLTGQTAVVYNRSEVVGRPLAAMLANDGARVFSVDITGMMLYTAGSVAGTIRVAETEVTQDEALAAASIVVGGVPAKSFKVPTASVRPGAIAINFSAEKNFDADVAQTCTYVPAIGKVTISMLERNLMRLHSNFHAGGASAGERLLRRLMPSTSNPVAVAATTAAAAAVLLCALKSLRQP